MSAAVPSRDPAVTARTLERWFADRLQVTSVVVSDLSVPKAGFSNETIVGHARWSDAAEVPRDLDFVLRIEPTAHQLFLEPDALRQAAVMTALGGHVPVPRIVVTEDDAAVLGAPFFLMEQVHGRIPGDVPSWHRRGWTAALDADEQRTLHDNALAALAGLHRVQTDDPVFAFLQSASSPATVGHGPITALDRMIGAVATMHEWCRPVLRYDVDIIERAMQFVIDAIPGDHRRSVVWGDARVGNMIFADDLTVAAMLDWEGATLGPPEVDVAWWVMFDEFLCEAQGVTRLPGVHDRLATFERYQELAGVELVDIGFYEVLAGLQLCLINSRLADLLISSGKAEEPVAAEFVARVAGITSRSLSRLGAL